MKRKIIYSVLTIFLISIIATNPVLALSESEVNQITSNDYRLHSDDIDDVRNFYNDNEDDLDTTTSIQIEAWLEWAESGDRDVPKELSEDIHPDLLDFVEGDVEEDSTDTDETDESNETVNQDVSDRELGDLTITSYEFRDEDIIIQYETDETVESTWNYIEMEDGSISQLIQDDITFDEDDETVIVPVSPTSNSVLSLQTEDGHVTALEQLPPPLIRNLDVFQLWIAAGAGALGSVLYALHFFIRRRGIFSEIQSASTVIKGKTNNNLANEIKYEDVDESDDAVTTIIKKYFSLKQFLKYGIVGVGLVFIANSFGLISLGIPTPSDYVVVGLGFIAISYITVAPLVLAPILKAIWSTDLEFVKVTDNEGNVNETYVAEKGVFKKRYKNASQCPISENEKGEPVYVVSELDTENKTCEPAFSWNLSDDADVSDDYIELQGEIIWIDQILNDSEIANFVFKNMFMEAEEGRQLRKFYPMIRQAIRYEEGKDIAIGISKAMSGTSVESVLSDRISSYKSKEEQLEQKYRKKSKEEESIDEIKNLIDNNNNTGDEL